MGKKNDKGPGRRQPGYPKDFMPPMPEAPAPMENFLPMTAEFEAGRRAIMDQLASTLAQIGVARDQIPYVVKMFDARMKTDMEYETNRVREAMSGRGVLNSGATGTTLQRDVYRPLGRAKQDFTLDVAGQEADLASAEAEAQLQANMALQNHTLQRANQVASSQPLSLPQFGGMSTESFTTPNLGRVPRRNRPRRQERGRR